MIGRLALLFGLFVVPVVLLAIGHRLRDRSPVLRGVFWGGVVGHTVALIIAVLALHFPPVLWVDDVRRLIAFWVLLVGGVVGAALGALRAHGE